MNSQLTNEELGRKKLLVNFSLIVNHVFFEDVIDSLYSNIHNLSADTFRTLLKEASNEKKMRKLLTILTSNEEEDVYKWFVKALVDAEVMRCDEVANILENTQLTEDSVCVSKEETLGKEVVGMSAYIESMQENDSKKEIPYNKDYCSSANLAGESINNFVSFTFSKRTEVDKLKEIPVYVALSMCNFNPPDRNSIFKRYYDALNSFQNIFKEKEINEIKDCIKNLLEYEIKGYEPVVIIAKEMFTECNLGILVTWFQFWKMLVSEIKGPDDKIKLFCEYVGFFLNEIPAYQEWAKTGWDKMLLDAHKREDVIRNARAWLSKLIIFILKFYVNVSKQ